MGPTPIGISSPREQRGGLQTKRIKTFQKENSVLAAYSATYVWTADFIETEPLPSQKEG